MQSIRKDPNATFLGYGFYELCLQESKIISCKRNKNNVNSTDLNQ